MISYGRTPSEPTIPLRTTLPGIHVLARRRRTPATGATSRPMVRCFLGVSEVELAVCGERSLSLARALCVRLERLRGRGMFSGTMTKISVGGQ
jgi:hypothetical protein